MPNWKKCKLGDVATTTTTKISCSDITSNYISTENMLPDKGGIVAASSLPNLGNVSIYHKGDVLVSNIRPYFKKIWHATVDGAASNDVIVFHANEGVNSRYLYYTLADDNFFAYVMTGAKGTKMPRGDKKQMMLYPVFCPPLEEQKRIAEILGSLDDKIELLQKQNKTLEDMAKALFKSWFVDFDVVRAKAALATRRNLSPLRGKCHNVAKGGPNKPNSSCALVSTHQIYAKSVKNLVRAMRQNLTPQEVKLWQYLRKEQLGVKFRRQFPIDSKYIADFACLEKKLIIELDGTQHAENQHDKERTLYLEDHGFTVLRFWNNEIDKNLIGCLERIRELLNRPPLPAYEENGADNTPLPACGVLSPQGGQKTAGCGVSSPLAGEVADKPMGGIKRVENGADNTPLPACGVLSPQGGQITGEADIMREYHLTDELYDLFPFSFADSPLGPIPSGWEVKPLSKIATFLNGLALQKYPARAEEDFLPVIKIAELRNGISTSTDKANTNLPTEYIVHNGDILFSWSGSLMVKVWSGEKGALNQHLFKVFSNGYPKWFYYLWVNHYLPMFQEIAADKATTMGHIQRKHLDQAKVVCPSSAFLDKMDKIFGVILSKIILNNKQIQTLTELRDTLLPRLISGKIRV